MHNDAGPLRQVSISLVPKARVEYHHSGQWCFHCDVEGRTAEQAEEAGKIEARKLWKSGVAGVRVVVSAPTVVLEHMR